MGHQGQIKLSFLMVGHTHEDVDQFFSRISVKCHQQAAVTRPDLHQLISTSAENKRLRDKNEQLKKENERLKRQKRHQDVFEYAEDLEQTEPTVRKTYQRKVTAEVEVHLEEAHKKRRIQKEKEERYIELIDEIIREDEAETTEVTEAIEEDNEVVENIQEVTNEVTFSKGEKITAFWEDKNISGWYPAVVLRVNKNSYYVRFFDGVKSSLKPKDIKKTAN
ncbi:PHF20 [Mytilus edulis]|uniref:PHF20 n=1 Tax=Mytilus edulis TaxID=6550 RepID=A0A8S3SP56_MYTED|nr:PHF20 [Mytilus edulis]